MRIAFISTVLGYPWGGADSLWTAAAAHSIASGNKIFLGISRLTAEHNSVQAIIDKGAEVFYRDSNSIYLGNRDKFKRKLHFLNKKYLEWHLSQFRPDVVIVNQGATYDVLSEKYLVEWLEKTLTRTIVICENNPGAVLKSCERNTLKNFFKYSKKIFFVSELNREQAERDLECKMPQAKIIQNPLVFADNGSLPWLSTKNEPIKLGLVGRLDVNHKGIDMLIKALAALANHFEFTLTMTGRNETPELLNEIIDCHNLKSRIQIRPFSTGTELIESYQKMELFLLTSRYEGCATTMLEALCCGRPVLATPVGGVKEWIVDGVNGYVTSDVSSEAIGAALERALVERSRFPSLGTNARFHFEAKHDPDPALKLFKEIEIIANISA